MAPNIRATLTSPAAKMAGGTASPGPTSARWNRRGRGSARAQGTGGTAHRSDRSGAGGARKQSGRAVFLPFPLPRGPASASNPRQSPSLWGEQEGAPFPSTSAPAAVPRARLPVRVCVPARRGARPRPLRWPSPPSRCRALPQGYASQAGSYVFNTVSRAGSHLPWGLGTPQAMLRPREGGLGLAGVFWVAAIPLSGQHGPAKISWQIIGLNLPPSAFPLSVPVCWCPASPGLALRQRQTATLSAGAASVLGERVPGPAPWLHSHAQPFPPLND